MLSLETHRATIATFERAKGFFSILLRGTWLVVAISPAEGDFKGRVRLNRMLKKSASFVLGYSVSSLPAALLDGLFDPPTQTAVGHSLWRRTKTAGASPGMNAPGLRSRSDCFGGVGKEGELLRRIPPKKLTIPRAPGLRSRSYFGGVG